MHYSNVQDNSRTGQYSPSLSLAPKIPFCVQLRRGCRATATGELMSALAFSPVLSTPPASASLLSSPISSLVRPPPPSSRPSSSPSVLPSCLPFSASLLPGSTFPQPLLSSHLFRCPCAPLLSSLLISPSTLSFRSLLFCPGSSWQKRQRMLCRVCTADSAQHSLPNDWRLCARS